MFTSQTTQSLFNLITIVSIIDTVVLIVVLLRAFMLWITGISPVLFRLGNGLARRKIAIFAKSDNAESLRGLLQDSKLFKNSNIILISNPKDIGRAEEASVYLVYWHDWCNDINQILDLKPLQDKSAIWG